MGSIKLNSQWAGKPQESQFKGYRKFIAGKMFTLGVDEAVAQKKAQALVLAAENLPDEGWTEEIVKNALAFATGSSTPQKRSQAKSTGHISVYGALEAFRAVLLRQYTPTWSSTRSTIRGVFAGSMRSCSDWRTSTT